MIYGVPEEVFFLLCVIAALIIGVIVTLVIIAVESLRDIRQIEGWNDELAGKNSGKKPKKKRGLK